MLIHASFVFLCQFEPSALAMYRLVSISVCQLSSFRGFRARQILMACKILFTMNFIYVYNIGESESLLRLNNLYHFFFQLPCGCVLQHLLSEPSVVFYLHLEYWKYGGFYDRKACFLFPDGLTILLLRGPVWRCCTIQCCLMKCYLNSDIRENTIKTSIIASFAAK